jgi:CubicO group peptidase (beta-lactamase class C family)
MSPAFRLIQRGTKAIRLYALLGFLFLLTACSKEPEGEVFVPYSWDFSSPEAEGMDPVLLDSAFHAADTSGYVDGLLIVRDGKIVAEAYYNGFSAEYPHNLMSVSKSMLSALAGIALDGDYGLDLEDRVLDYFPEYDHSGLDPRKGEITVNHLLTMRMGIEREAADNYGVYFSLYNSDNWIRNTIEYPLVADPGEEMRYNTFITHLLSGVITRATGKSTLEFASEKLFSPMGIDVDFWEQDPQGIYFGGNSMHLTPREMAAFGLLYLQGGSWEGKQLIPAEWVEHSLEPSTDLSHPNHWGTWENYNYASLWWLGQFNGQDSFMGYGYGGQFVIVFPDLDLIVVATCNNNVPPEETNAQEWGIFELVTRFILPSLS